MAARLPFHFSVRPIYRSLAKSGAYVMGIALLDTRTGLLSNFVRRGAGDRDEIVFADLLLPGGRSENVGFFVNRVMRRNNKRRAVFGRTITAAIPASLSEDEMRRYVSQYAKRLVARYGVGVIVAIHRPPAKRREAFGKAVLADGQPAKALNWHVHFLLSYCTVNEHGVLGNKQRLLDPNDCSRMRVQNFCEFERARWQAATNDALAASGSAVRVDHRTLLEQGSMDRPTRYHGPTASATMVNKASKRRAMAGDAEPDVVTHNRNVRDRNTKRRQNVQAAIERLQRHRRHRARMLAVIDRMIVNEKPRLASDDAATAAMTAATNSDLAVVDVLGSDVSRSESNRWWQAMLSESRRPEVEACDWRHGIMLFTDGGVIVKNDTAITLVDGGSAGQADDLLSDVRHELAVNMESDQAFIEDAWVWAQRNRTRTVAPIRNDKPFSVDQQRLIDAQFGVLRPLRRRGGEGLDEAVDGVKPLISLEDQIPGADG